MSAQINRALFRCPPFRVFARAGTLKREHQTKAVSPLRSAGAVQEA